MMNRMLARISLLAILVGSWAFGGDRFLVRTPAAKIGEVASRHSLRVIKTLDGHGRGLYLVRAEDPAKAALLKADRDVESVEEDLDVWLPEVSNAKLNTATPRLGKASAVDFFGVQALGAYVNQEAGYTVALSGARVFATGAGTVAILDTGVDVNHPLLAGALVEGYDFTRNQPGGSEMFDVAQSTTAILDGRQSTTAILDKNSLLTLNQSTTAILDQSTTAILDGIQLPAAFGHGTMVAGLVRLVAPTAKIMPVKVFTGDGESSLSQVVAGIYWAVDHGAKVINMSFHSLEDSRELKRAIAYANSRRVICVASVGNEGQELVVYPAAYGIGVGSTSNLMVRSPFSNYGDVVGLAAPGEGVITLYPGNNYAAAWGTSFSAPFVAGGAALLVQLGPETNQSQAAHALSEAEPIGQGLGAGELNLFRACLRLATR